MENVFKDFATYIKLHDGMGKPKINFQEMYRLFPSFEFIGVRGKFGSYENFGKAYEQKVYDMVITANDGKDECYMTYREYGDADENAAYVS